MVIKVSAPGKLFVAGEWAILEPKNFGIVAAIKKRIFAEIKKSPDKNIYISLRDFNINNLKANFSQGKLRYFNPVRKPQPSRVGFKTMMLSNGVKKLTKKERKALLFSKSAIETVLRYLNNWQPFQIKIWGEITEKIGFGFSAASTVAIVAALLKFNRQKLEKEKIFKLAALAHFLGQGKIGSGFDICASTYGGIFVYRRFNPLWLEKEIKKEKEIRKIIEKPWPNFYFEKLNWPKNLQLLIGWTGKSALTKKLIEKFTSWKEKNQSEYKKIILGIGKLVKELISAWKLGRKEKILELIRENENYLRELGEKSKLNIETKKLRKLVEIANKFGGAGKVSGAGGGDCGIAFTFEEKMAKLIAKEWRKQDILPLKAGIDFSGVKIHAVGNFRV
jgi:phosphomevalonate kinase